MKTLEELGISPTPWEMKEAVPGILYVSDNDKDLVCNATFSAAPDEDIRLIAAAPDLYAALRGCVEKMCEYCRKEARYSLPGRTCESGCAVMLAAKAALEKAGGKTDLPTTRGPKQDNDAPEYETRRRPSTGKRKERPSTGKTKK